MGGWKYGKPDIYEGNKGSERFALGRRGDNPLICFGINPSTADDDTPDPTMSRIEKIAERRGHKGWLMLNVYPRRATNPKCLGGILLIVWGI